MFSTAAPHPVVTPRIDDGADPVVASLPVLDEVPELAAALEVARRIDRLVADLVGRLLDLQAHDVAEHTTGVPLEQWLAIVGRRTGADRRMLLTTCEVLRRLPSLRAAFLSDGSVSWAQVRSLALRVERLPRHLDDRLDAELARAIEGTADADPDALGNAISWVLGALDPGPQQAEQRVAEDHEFFAMQPRLDGSGGRVWGEFGPVGFATLDAVLHDPGDRPAGRTRAGFGHDPDPDAAREAATSAGRARAARLLELLEVGAATVAGASRSTAATAGTDPIVGTGAVDDAGAREGAEAGDREHGPTPSKPGRSLLVRVELATLLDRSALPATLLTTLTGGRMWVDAPTARRLADEREVDLRLVVVDDTGAVVGVGRKQRYAPGWLRDATLALHDTCSAPGCRVAARLCQVDHARPWTPRTDRGPGRTDIDQLAPLCGTDNHDKEAAGWRVAQHPDGSRTWHHPRTGLTTRTMPATWRPPPRRGP
jgi:hypothetical protein